MALDIAPAEQIYEPKDCMLYALGVGLGHDPMNEDELAFVYEKNLKVLPTMATVLAHSGSLARNPDSGINWVMVVNGEQGFTLERPLAGEGVVIGRTRIVEVIDKGAGKGALLFTERKITDKATGALIGTVTQTMFCRGDGGFGGPPRQSPPPHPIPSRAPDAVLRFRHPSGNGADLSPERRLQSVARRARRRPRPRASTGRSCTGSALSACPATRCSKPCAATIRRG